MKFKVNDRDIEIVPNTIEFEEGGECRPVKVSFSYRDRHGVVWDVNAAGYERREAS